jgi:hypothetical protein
MKSKQTAGNLFLVFLLCVSTWLGAIMFVVKWLSTDFDTALEYFCSFIDGVFNE